MTSSFLTALNGAKQLIADCPAFQTRVGAGSATEAMDSIYSGEAAIEELDDPNNTLRSQRPLVILNLAEAGFEQFAIADGGNMGQYCGFLVTFEDNPSEEGNAEDQYIDFLDFVGSVMDWISRKVGLDQPSGNPDAATNTYPAFMRMYEYCPIQRSDLTQRRSDDFFMTQWHFSQRVGTGS